MSRADYNSIKEIIDEIVGDTHQGNVLLKAIKGYFKQKENIKIVRREKEVKAPEIKYVPMPNNNMAKEAEEAMKRYTKKLAKENEKYRKRSGRAKTCSVNS
tara:strand:+ start:305 stop:607 length:303 start_codon:yes stop_codon:yes gene_type:complete